jgi:hypothetical protein
MGLQHRRARSPLGFSAALLIIDRTWPITGLLMSYAQSASARLARRLSRSA